MACRWLALFTRHISRQILEKQHSVLYMLVNVQKNLVYIHPIYYTSISCRSMSIVCQEREKDFKGRERRARKIFYGDILFHRSHRLRKNFEMSFFLSRIRGVILFYASPYHERKKPIRRDAVWMKGGQRGGGSFRRAEMLNYPIACERM